MHRNPSVTLPSRAERPAERDTHIDSTDLQFGLDTVLDFIRYGTTPRRMVYSRAVRVLLCRAVYCRVLCIRSSHRVGYCEVIRRDSTVSYGGYTTGAFFVAKEGAARACGCERST